MPPRAELLSPEPLGAGTTLRESLTGYFNRLGRLHVASPHDLGRFVLSRHVSAWEHPTTFHHDAAAFNGLGVGASSFVLALESATLRGDLASCTMLPFAELLASRGLVRQSRAWCPGCLEEWAEQGLEGWEPLIWCLQAATCCPKHGSRLATRCLECGKAVGYMPLLATATHCPACSAWLGTAPSDPAEASEIAEAQAVGSLLEVPELLWPAMSGATFRRVLTQLATELTGGSESALCHQLGMSQPGWVHWMYGGLPSLPRLALLAVRFGTTIPGLLLEPGGLQVHDGPPLGANRVHVPVRRVLAEMRGELRQPAEEARSLAQVAAAAGVSEGRLRGADREMADQIVARAKARQLQDKARSAAILRQEVFAAVESLVTAGDRVTRRSVSARLTRPGWMADPRARLAFFDACEQFDIRFNPAARESAVSRIDHSQRVQARGLGSRPKREMHRRPRRNRFVYSREDCIAAIRQAIEEERRVIGVGEWDRWKKVPSRQVLKRFFPTWNAALRAAGVEPIHADRRPRHGRSRGPER